MTDYYPAFSAVTVQARPRKKLGCPGGRGGWRDGSAVKGTDCSSIGPEFNSQQTHDGSQPSVVASDALF